MIMIAWASNITHQVKWHKLGVDASDILPLVPVGELYNELVLLYNMDSLPLQQHHDFH